MSTPEQRLAMAKSIVDFEARRDSKRRLVVHKLLKEDGGGRYEVAGINERYNKDVCDELVALIESGQHTKAEALAIEYIASNTDVVVSWTRSTPIEAYLRDCAFNRGHAGSAKILQYALGVVMDGVVGPKTRAVIAVSEQDPGQLLNDLRDAREWYERNVARRNERSVFWKGLVNRWNNALKFARTFLSVASPTFVPPVVPQRVTELGDIAAAPGLETAQDIPYPLRALRIGMRGNLVLAWQTFLVGQRVDPGEPDGVFGDKTLAATKAFQEKVGVVADGVVGRQTLKKALARGFELIEEPSPAPDKTGSNFPARPSFAPLVYNSQRQAVFGSYAYVHAPTKTNKERIRILGSWERDNIVSVPIPQLKKTAMGSKAPSTMRFHRLAAGQLQALWAAWEDAGLLKKILTYAGAYNPRFIRGSTKTLSNHAFGSAFDINATWNWLGTRPALVGEKGCIRELVPIAHEHGFYWGGHFSRRDGMHFEVATMKT